MTATLVAVVAAAVVQGTIGMGFGMVLVPVLAVMAPGTLPAAPLLLSLPLMALIAARERGDLDRKGLPRLLAGRALGTLAAVWLLLVLTDAALEVLFGLVILGVVALSVSRPAVRPTTGTQVGAGALSGLFATTAAIGGPPVALLYQGRPGPQVRSTLAVVFLLGGLLSIASLFVAERLRLEHLLLTLLLTPAMLAGFLLSRPLARFIDRGWLRPAVLTFAAAAAVLAIARGLAS